LFPCLLQTFLHKLACTVDTFFAQLTARIPFFVGASISNLLLPGWRLAFVYRSDTHGVRNKIIAIANAHYGLGSIERQKEDISIDVQFAKKDNSDNFLHDFRSQVDENPQTFTFNGCCEFDHTAPLIRYSHSADSPPLSIDAGSETHQLSSISSQEKWKASLLKSVHPPVIGTPGLPRERRQGCHLAPQEDDYVLPIKAQHRVSKNDHENGLLLSSDIHDYMDNRKSLGFPAFYFDSALDCTRVHLTIVNCSSLPDADKTWIMSHFPDASFLTLTHQNEKSAAKRMYFLACRKDWCLRQWNMSSEYQVLEDPVVKPLIDTLFPRKS